MKTLIKERFIITQQDIKAIDSVERLAVEFWFASITIMSGGFLGYLLTA